MSEPITAEQVRRVALALEQVTDDLETVYVGAENVACVTDVRSWLRTKARDEDFVHWINDTGPYSKDPA